MIRRKGYDCCCNDWKSIVKQLWEKYREIVRAVKLNGRAYYPDGEGIVDLGEIESGGIDEIPTTGGMNGWSVSNPVTLRDFVNSSIATNTANYISDNGEPFDSLADLQAYTGTLTNNDYAFVVGTDAAGNTTYTRYKYNAGTEEWAEEYVLNNSSFTAQQWAAINSGATAANISQISGLAGDVYYLTHYKQGVIHADNNRFLSINDWDTTTLQQSLIWPGIITDTSLIWVGPAPQSIDAWVENNVRAISQSQTNGITFQCDTLPTVSIQIVIAVTEV